MYAAVGPEQGDLGVNFESYSAQGLFGIESRDSHFYFSKWNG